MLYAAGVATAAMVAMGASVTNADWVFGKLCLYLSLVAMCMETVWWCLLPKLDNSLFAEVFTASDGRAEGDSQ